MSKIKEQLKAQLLDLRKVLGISLALFVAIISIIGIALITMGYDSSTLESILTGAVSSLVAGVIFYLVFSVVSEESLRKYAAKSASLEAVEYVLDRLDMVPRHTYPAANNSNEEFSLKLNDCFNNSNIYFFKGASAGFLSYRLSSIGVSEKSDELQIHVLLLNPHNDLLLREFAISNLKKSDTILDSESIDREKEKIAKEIYVNLITQVSGFILASRGEILHQSYSNCSVKLSN